MEEHHDEHHEEHEHHEHEHHEHEHKHHEGVLLVRRTVKARKTTCLRQVAE